MIQRYDLYGWEGNKMVEPSVEEDPNGDWVKYEDVRAILEGIDSALKYAFQDGKDAAMRDPDHG